MLLLFYKAPFFVFQVAPRTGGKARILAVHEHYGTVYRFRFWFKYKSLKGGTRNTTPERQKEIDEVHDHIKDEVLKCAHRLTRQLPEAKQTIQTLLILGFAENPAFFDALAQYETPAHEPTVVRLPSLPTDANFRSRNHPRPG